MSICLDELPPYGEDACAPVMQADMDALALIKSGQTSIIDYTDATQWATAIAANDVEIVKNVKAGIPEPSPRTQGNPRVQGPENILNGFTSTITLEDATVSAANTAFYAALNGQTREVAVRLYYENQSLLALYPYYWIVSPVYGEAGNVLMYKGTGVSKISPSDTIDLFTTPAGIFD